MPNVYHECNNIYSKTTGLDGLMGCCFIVACVYAKALCLFEFIMCFMCFMRLEKERGGGRDGTREGGEMGCGFVMRPLGFVYRRMLICTHMCCELLHIEEKIYVI
eukprot:GHVS01085395.1.p1 GENE.GHVS01085395.1~~GHVS01085395.1.p1  ORF type:complete len:105 (-),score=14.13 GHVS01085395.1:436-750(-)